jgi:hypothetical protein
MSVKFQDSNVMLASVRPTSRSKRIGRARRGERANPSALAFSSLLPQDEIEDSDDDLPELLRGLPSLTRGTPLDPSVYMQQLYGREFDPATGRVNHAIFLERTQEKTLGFVQMFGQALTEASLDQEPAIALLVNELGQVEAREHPQSTAITGLFAIDRDLSQTYREVAEAHHWAALTEIGAAYVEAWYGTEDFDQREDISESFRKIFDHIAESASQTTYQAGSLDSASVTAALTALETLNAPAPNG